MPDLLQRVAVCVDGPLQNLFTLEEAFHHLNHGSYGGAVKVVQQAANRWRDAMEACPSRFIEVSSRRTPVAVLLLELRRL